MVYFGAHGFQHANKNHRLALRLEPFGSLPNEKL
jgi:hypothetical protein